MKSPHERKKFKNFIYLSLLFYLESEIKLRLYIGRVNEEVRCRLSNFVITAVSVPNYVIRCVRLLVCPLARCF